MLGDNVESLLLKTLQSKIAISGQEIFKKLNLSAVLIVLIPSGTSKDKLIFGNENSKITYYIDPFLEANGGVYL